MASNVHNVDGDEAASLLTGSAPLSVSPLPANDAKRRSTARRQRRKDSSPFAAVFRSASCALASANDDDHQVALASSAGGERGGNNARRPRLQELLRIESSSNPPEFNAAEPADDDFSKESGAAIVVFDFPEDETSRDRDEEEYGAPALAISDDPQHVLLPCNEEKQTVDIMAPLDYFNFNVVGDKPAPEACTGGAAVHVVSLTVLVNMKRIGLLVAALREHSRALKGSYWRQAAGRRAADGHAELFYHRPIALGRRCRVQHQPE